jgi:hypothetical protein
VKNKDPSRRSQLFPPSLGRLKQSAIFQQQQQAIRKLRELLPRYTPEELEKLRAMLAMPQLPADLPPELAKLLREHRDRQSEQLVEPAPEQAAEAQGEQGQQTTEQPSEQLVEPSPEQALEKRGPGAPRADIPHLEEAVAALAKKQPDPRKQVTKRDINCIIEYLKDKHGFVVSQKDPDQRPTIRRRIQHDRSARMQVGLIKRSH